MDIIFVRTKLQALIVLNLLTEKLISKKFIFVKCHRNDINEDSEEISFVYNKIENKAFYTTHLVEENGLIRCSLQVYFLSILALISCGKFFLAGINYYGFSIAAKFNPLIKIITFDDGTANFNKNSTYFKHEKLDDNLSVRRSFLNFVFPHGASFFLKKKIILHYTIFKNIKNIVPRNKLKHIKINWNNHLSNEDLLFLKRFIKSEVSVLIGTVFQDIEPSIKSHEQTRKSIKNFEQRFLSKIDFIISHPRDSSNFSRLKISRSFHGPAESVITFLHNQSLVEKINIYHFRSTAILTIKAFSKVKLFDIAGKYIEFVDIEDNSDFRELIASNNL